MIAFIDDHRAAYGVEPICKVLPIAPSIYYEHAAKRTNPEKQSDRGQRDEVLQADIQRVFAANFEVYGARKVWRQLQREGRQVARCTVERLMRSMGLQGAVRGKPVRTTVSDKASPCPQDRVNRQFQAPAPNMLWVSDFTYVARGKALSMWRSSSMHSPGASLAGVSVGQRMPVSSSMLWTRRCTIGGRCSAAALSITATGAASMSRSNTPNVWLRPVSNPPSAASVTAMTTLSPRPSTAFTRPR